MVSPVIQRPIHLTHQHRVAFTHGAFEPANHTLRDLIAEGAELDGRGRVLVLLDEGLLAGNPRLPEKIGRYFDRHGDAVQSVSAPVILPGGEGCKNDWPLVETIWRAIDFHKLCRHSHIVAVGGGAFLDLAGFAAATAHRGIRLIRMPTTTLSQGDGGVGVKNGVNFFGKKNWVGTFAVPFAVVNDLDFLKSLPAAACRDGLIEAIKVALIRDRAFFEYLESRAAELSRLETEPLERAIRRSAELHVEHIATGGDPFELGSARPLDFGHWAAHKLEPLSAFAVSHGAAVAIGMALDLLYSVRVGLLNRATAERVIALIEGVGFRLWSDFLDKNDPATGLPAVLAGLEEFREHLGGRLTITLVPEIGRKIEVHEMDRDAVIGALADLRARAEASAPRATTTPSR
ncbi:MAG: 3-dehydroquinate synthase [Verrucomicrobiae bacterium]|nr:3-dehydroquinate synthase [Verrucomicrobiae bacterium]MCP5541792.1 3-dehydroquinate synthase [Akkermansiaceae bacterium]